MAEIKASKTSFFRFLGCLTNLKCENVLNLGFFSGFYYFYFHMFFSEKCKFKLLFLKLV